MTGHLHLVLHPVSRSQPPATDFWIPERHLFVHVYILIFIPRSSYLAQTFFGFVCLFVNSSTLLWGEEAVSKSEPISAVNKVILGDQILLDRVLMSYNSVCLGSTNLRLSHPPKPCLLDFLSAKDDHFILQVLEVNIQSLGRAWVWQTTLYFRVVLDKSLCLRFCIRNATQPFCEYPFCKPWTEGCWQKSKPLNPMHTQVYMHISYQNLDKVSPCSRDRFLMYNLD